MANMLEKYAAPASGALGFAAAGGVFFYAYSSIEGIKDDYGKVLDNMGKLSMAIEDNSKGAVKSQKQLGNFEEALKETNEKIAGLEEKMNGLLVGLERVADVIGVKISGNKAEETSAGFPQQGYPFSPAPPPQNADNRPQMSGDQVQTYGFPSYPGPYSSGSISSFGQSNYQYPPSAPPSAPSAPAPPPAPAQAVQSERSVEDIMRALREKIGPT